MATTGNSFTHKHRDMFGGNTKNVVVGLPAQAASLTYKTPGPKCTKQWEIKRVTLRRGPTAWTEGSGITIKLLQGAVEVATKTVAAFTANTDEDLTLSATEADLDIDANEKLDVEVVTAAGAAVTAGSCVDIEYVIRDE